MASRLVTNAERRVRLAEQHRLTTARRTNDIATIVEDLVALHASDPATVFLSAATRMEHPSIEAMERALYRDRSVLRHHAMRRTIWVATPRTMALMNSSSTRKIARAERKLLLKYLGQTDDIDDPEEVLENTTRRLLEWIDHHGPLSTRAIGKLDPDLTFKLTVGSGKHAAKVGAHTRIGNLAAFEGILLRTRPSASWISSEFAWERTERWSSIDFGMPDVRSGAAGLLGAWLEQFGPGTERDLKWWTGWTSAAVRTALADIKAVQVRLEGDETGWIGPADPFLAESESDTNRRTDTEPWIALLPGLDPTVMGWKDRRWYLDRDIEARVFDRNGNAGPTVWADGNVVGGWAQRPDGSFALELQRPLSSRQQQLLQIEVERVRNVIGEARFRVRFPSPNQKQLLDQP